MIVLFTSLDFLFYVYITKQNIVKFFCLSLVFILELKKMKFCGFEVDRAIVCGLVFLSGMGKIDKVSSRTKICFFIHGIVYQ